MDSAYDTQRVRRRLRIVRWVALADAVLLITLVSASWMGNRHLVSVLGPLHGGNFLLLLALSGTGAADSLWPWWFPALVLLTAGPPGALLGEWLLERRIKTQSGGTANPHSRTRDATKHARSTATGLEEERRTPR